MNKKQAVASEVPPRPQVLVVIRWPVGGIRTWCRYVYRDAKFRAFDITLLFPGGPEAKVLEKDLADSGIKLVTTGDAASTLSFWRTVTKHIMTERYSMVHSHGFTSALTSYFACSIKGTRHLVTPHDVVLDEQYSGVRGWVSRRLIARVLGSADAVQAVGFAAGDNLKQAFPGCFGNGERLVVVRNGIETSRFLSAQASEVRETFGIPGNAILVGFFGRFMSQKGFKYLVAAVKDYTDAGPQDRPMVVLAVGGGGFEREEQELIVSQSLADNFRFVGFSENVAGLLKAVDVVAMPSLWEACPLLPMEALTAGAPIVVSDCEPCLELAEGSPAEVVPMRDSASLLRAIIGMSSLTAKQSAAQYAGTAAARFDVAQTRKGVLELYGRITGFTL
jgi:glycosyltransferase involved in cell wall biosynthesis